MHDQAPAPAGHASESAQIVLIGAPQSATPGGRDSRHNGGSVRVLPGLLHH
jgi:hypothetical protein